MKTSYEMAQSVLYRQKKILRRRRAVLTAFGATAGVGVIAAAFTLSMTLSPSKGVDLIDSSTPGNALTLPNDTNANPLDLLGFLIFQNGKYFIDIDHWQKSDDYELFRKYFFGTWESSDKTFAEKFVIDDTENAYLAENNAFRFQDFYIISENVLAFVIQGSAECKLFWLDINSPEIMYYEPYTEYQHMMNIANSADIESFGGSWLYDIEDLPHKPAVYSKTAYPDYAPINVPEKDHLRIYKSIYKLREISRDYGIDMDMLLNIEYVDKNSGERLLHDDWYHFYPVYLVSEEPDKLIFHTTLGNILSDTEKAEVTYTIEKVDGVWTRTEEIGISTEDVGFGINDDVISELGMTYRELADKYGCEPRGKLNSYIIENGYGRYCWKTSSGFTYDNMEQAGGCNMIDGVKLSDLFSDISYPVSYEELEEKYGFTLIEAATELDMFDLYESTFELPSYDNIRFCFFTREYGIIEEDTSCMIKLKNAGKPNEDLFSTEDWISFQETANNAAEAFLRNDKEQLSEYLYDPEYDTGLSENSENLFDKLVYSELTLIDSSIAAFETGKVYPAVYKYALVDIDMYFYLDIGLRKTDSGWKVDDICLQG